MKYEKLKCKNLLFVANKPMFISSNKFLNQLKKKYNIKKMGFSGTLDPFATGCLIIATGQYTKLFRFLDKTPKTYIATLMLGAYSPTLDIEKIENIQLTPKIEKEKIIEVLNSFLGKQTQIPPKYSAKKIDGKRAYALANKNIDIKLKEIEVEIYEIELINYSHPFITFRASVSEGTFIRTLGLDIAKKLNTFGSLTYLERVNEGKFKYECEKPLNPLEFLKIPQNFYKNDINNLLLGKKLDIKDFEIQQPGTYYIKYDKYFAIIEIKESIKYILNRIELC
ncbi:tRNA pseudouridine(55) synthase TruB [Caminibacter mediatlanticus TB-2]|uniref:tRNA pseudouridine synthase B n=1 Tax=Caminibacter mediatlanticus TB-2 TaxID=391592 RepID=A0ABX5VA23_9BACT|nr:tRNA pseudouridine(55) synthase TruB [Caminibacter mediatlanticus]QCT95140.1 tRNA pseudouridine(55) synthase TruB [Caminibacter mediatlanticus TB-2]